MEPRRPRLPAEALPAGTPARRRLKGRGPAPLVLEQRFMFDGAAVDTAAAVVKQAADAATPTVKDAAIDKLAPAALETNRDTQAGTGATLFKLDPSAANLGDAAAVADQAIRAFLAIHADESTLFAFFNGRQETASGDWLQAARSLRQDILEGRYSVDVKVIGNAEIGGVFAAFVGQGPGGKPTIFINRDWLASSPGADTVGRVLIEELGHSLDRALNGDTDTAGDEGEAFAMGVLNHALSDNQRQDIAQQDDHSAVVVDGVSYAAEDASLTFNSVYEGTPSSWSEEASSLNNIQTFSGTNFRFVSADPSAPYYSGNNVSGWLKYTDSNSVEQQIFGVVSRQFKTNGVVNGFYFYTTGADGIIGTHDSGETAYLLVVNASKFTVGGNYGTSSDPVDTSLNNLLNNYTPAYAIGDTSDSPGAFSAQEQGGTNNTSGGRNATGNVLTNDVGQSSGAADIKVTQVSTTSTNVSVAAGTTSANGASVTGAYGTLTIGADGSYKYVVDNANATVQALRQTTDKLYDTFTYKITDSKGAISTATVKITIEGANDDPTAKDDYNTAKVTLLTDSTAYTSTDPLGTKATGNVLSNDTDVDRNGETKTIDGIAATGTYYSYTAGGATTSLTFSASSTLNNVSASYYIYYLSGGTYYQLKSGTTPITVTTNVKNADGTYSVALSGTPDNYTVGNGASVAFDNVSKASFTNTSGVKLATVSTATSIVTSTVTVSVTDGTVAIGMTVSGTNIPSGAKVTALATDGSGRTIVTLDKLLTSAPGGTLTFGATAGTTITGTYGTLTLSADGSYVYSPFASVLASGQSGVDSFKYTMRDGSGVTGQATLNITVLGSSSTDPNAVDDGASVAEGGDIGLPGNNVLSNDTTPSGSKTVVGARAVSTASDTAVPSGSYVDLVGLYGTLRLYSDGTYTYTHANSAEVEALNVGDSLKDVFLYKIRNTAGGVDTAALTITINGANDGPTAVNDTLAATEDTPITFTAADLVGNDTDVDGGALTVQSVTSGSGGTAVRNGDGTVTFTPNADFNGAATFTYTVSDGKGGTSTATVTVNVDAVNDAPVAKANTYTATTNTLLTGRNVLTDNDATAGTDSDPENNSLTISKVNGLLFTANGTDAGHLAADGWMQLSLTNGTLFIKQDGTTEYKPATGNSGGDSFTYIATDGTDESSGVTVTFKVAPAITGPSGSAGDSASAKTINENTTAVTQLTANETVTWSLVGGADQGKFSIDASGNLSFNSAPNFEAPTDLGDTSGNNTYVVQVKATNAAGNSSLQTVTVTVADVDEVPPTVTITSDKTALKAGETATLTFTFSEDVGSSFVVGDISVESGSLSNFTQVDATHYTATYTPAAGTTDASMVVSVGTGTFADTTGNANTGPASKALAVDTAAPTLTASTPADDATNVSVSNDLTLTFNENVVAGTGLVSLYKADGTQVESFDVATGTGNHGGTVAFNGTTGITLNPNADLTNSTGYYVTIAGTAVKDAAGNAYAGIGDSTTLSFSTAAPGDTTPPTVTITSDKTALKVGETATLTFTFSEDVGSSFAIGDISVESGSLSNFTQVDATHYTATYTPAAGTTDASMVVSVGTGTFADTTGNVNTGPAYKALAIDTAAPAITGPSGSAGDSASAKTINENTTAVTQLTANETVTWSLAGGADQGKFSIDASGNLSFNSAPNFEAPTDLGDTSGNNTYVVEVQATDAAGNTSTQTITVTVADVNDTTVTVTSPTVNERSPYAVFTVTGTAGQTVSLVLAAGTATGGGTDFGAAGSANLEVSTDGGTHWVSYSTAVTVPAGGTFLVRTPVIEDSIADNGETFTLTASIAGGTAVAGTATINDQGGGTLYNPDGSTDTATPPSDDRIVTVNSPVVSESSPYAVFTVTGGAGQVVSLSLQSGTATLGVDTVASSLQYFNGTAWVDYTGPIAMPAGGRLLVRTAIVSDSIYEGPETFSLTATPNSGTAAIGTATLKDDGSSANVFPSDNTSGTPTAGVADNDAAGQTLKVVSMTKDTGVSSGDFITNDGSAGRVVLGTLSAPLGVREVLQVSFDGGSTWQDVPSSRIVGSGNGTYTWTVVDPNAHSSSWTIEARVFNTDLGQPGAVASQDAVLDTSLTPPTVVTKTTVETQPTLSGTFDAADAAWGFSVTVDGRTYVLGVDTALTASGNTWSLDLAKGGQTLAVGSYDVVARSIDAAGNVSLDASAGELTVTPVPVQQIEPVKPAEPAPKSPAPATDITPEQPTTGAGISPSLPVSTSTIGDPIAKPQQEDVAGKGQGRREASETLTAPATGAARIAVIKADEPALMLFHGVPDQNFDTGALVRFQLPADAFVHTQEHAVVRITAERTEGGPLPSWLRFDASTGKFEGKPPANAPGEISVRVTARDADGREASTIFRIKLVSEKNDRLAGRPGLTQQLREAVKRPPQLDKLSKLERVTRIQAAKRAA